MRVKILDDDGNELAEADVVKLDLKDKRFTLWSGDVEDTQRLRLWAHLASAGNLSASWSAPGATPKPVVDAERLKQFAEQIKNARR